MKKELHINPKFFDKHTDILIDLYNATSQINDILRSLQRANQELPPTNYLDVSEVGSSLDFALQHLEKAKIELRQFVEL